MKPLLHLKSTTPPEWLALVRNEESKLLLDHAHAEQKAAAMAISLLNSFPDKPGLAETLPALALEEMDHFNQVMTLIIKRGYPFAKPEKDLYAGSLKKLIRNPRDSYFMDLLLVSAIIEARSCERFDILRREYPDEELRQFYQSLFPVEARHYSLFIGLALKSFSKELVFSRLDDLLTEESKILQALPVRPVMH